MTDWIEIGLLAAILLVQIVRSLYEMGAWTELQQRRRLRRRRKQDEC